MLFHKVYGHSNKRGMEGRKVCAVKRYERIERKASPKSYLRSAVMSADGHQSIYLQLDPLPSIRHESVCTPRRPLKIRRLYLPEATIRFAEQLPAVQRYIAHWNGTRRSCWCRNTEGSSTIAIQQQIQSLVFYVNCITKYSANIFQSYSLLFFFSGF